MKRLSLLLLSTSLCITAQQLSLSAPSQLSINQDSFITIDLGTSTVIAGLQWDIANAPAPAESLITGKQASCNANGRCLLFGLNLDPIPPGAVARIPVKFSASGTYRFALANVVAANPSGGSVPITAGPEVTITVRDPFDLDGDGSVGSGDLSSLVSGILNGAGVDLNGDGSANVADVIALVRRLP